MLKLLYTRLPAPCRDSLADRSLQSASRRDGTEADDSEDEDERFEEMRERKRLHDIERRRQQGEDRRRARERERQGAAGREQKEDSCDLLELVAEAQVDQRSEERHALSPSAPSPVCVGGE